MITTYLFEPDVALSDNLRELLGCYGYKAVLSNAGDCLYPRANRVYVMNADELEAEEVTRLVQILSQANQPLPEKVAYILYGFNLKPFEAYAHHSPAIWTIPGVLTAARLFDSLRHLGFSFEG